MRHRGTGAVIAWLVAAGTLLGAPVAHPESAPVAGAGAGAGAATFTDPHFREAPAFTGLDGPIAVRFAADGRAFVAEKRGRIVVFDSLADPSPTPVIDLRDEVHDFWDRGLLGFILDPGFLATGANARPFLYAYYVYDAPPGASAPTWGDTCPSPPGATDDGCVVTTKLVRFELDPETHAVRGTRQLLHDGCAQFPSHSGGGMAFGPDGMLYLAQGDGAAFHVRDYGQLGGLLPDPGDPVTPVNPCSDPVTVTSAPGEAPAVDPVTAEGGSLRSQDLRTAGDPVSLDGALLRIDPDTGAAAPGNPLAGDPDPNAARIVAYGLRNPFRLTTRPGTEELYLGNVGNNNWEEIERYVPGTGDTTGPTLPNFGWPCYEGEAPTDSWPQLGNALCEDLYAEGETAVLDPLYTWSHHTADGPCGIDGTLTSSVTGLAFYQAAAADLTLFPARYDGALFIADYARDCLSVLLPGPDGVPDPASMEVIGSGMSNPVDLVTGPHGDLYYPDLHGGRVMRVRYAADPVAVAVADPDVSLAPVTVTLDGSGSRDPDPDGELVAWRWDLDDDGVFDGPNDASGAVVEWFVATPGIYPVTLQVESSLGFTDTAELIVDTSNTPPVPSIDLPDAALTWSVGDVISFSGSATDVEDGALAATSLRWTLGLLHCGPNDCHEHIVKTLDGVAGGEMVGPDHPYPSRLRLQLEATDTHGTTRASVLELEPVPATLTVASSPSGVPLTIGDETAPAPVATTVIRGGRLAVSAPATHEAGGTAYRFGGWDDGATSRSRDVVVDGSGTLTAVYVTDAPDTCEAAQPIALRTWAPQHATGAGDEDWFSFSLGSARRVELTLGDLPVDARLDLYGACDDLLATSDHPGTRFETLLERLPAGSYRVRVSVPSGDESALPWVLRVRPLGSGLVVRSVRAARSSGVVRVAGELLNASGSVTGRATVIVKLRDASGRVIAKLTGSSFASRLGDGAVTPFRVVGKGPRYASITVKVREGDPVAGRRLVLRALTLAPNPNGTVTESGTVRNVGTKTAPSVAVARTWYDDRGEVLDVRIKATTPRRIEPGRRGRFTITRPALNGVQAASTAIRAR